VQIFVLPGLPEESCSRLMRAAVQIGFFRFTTTSGGVLMVENTRLSSKMRENDASGLKPMVKPPHIFTEF